MTVKENIPVGISISKVILPHNKMAIDLRVDRFGRHDAILTCRMSPDIFGRIIAGESHVQCTADIFTKTVNHIDQDIQYTTTMIDCITFPKPDPAMKPLQYRRYCQKRSAYIYIGENNLGEEGWFLKDVEDFKKDGRISKETFILRLARYTNKES